MLGHRLGVPLRRYSRPHYRTLPHGVRRAFAGAFSYVQPFEEAKLRGADQVGLEKMRLGSNEL